MTIDFGLKSEALLQQAIRDKKQSEAKLRIEVWWRDQLHVFEDQTYSGIMNQVDSIDRGLRGVVISAAGKGFTVEHPFVVVLNYNADPVYCEEKQ